MSQLQKLREETDKEMEELSEARSNLISQKSDITLLAVGVLLSKVEEAVNELLEVSFKKEYFDKTLGETIKSTIAEAIAAISKIQPPEIKVTPQINVDFKPLLSAFQKISEGQNTFISVIEEMKKGNNSDELMRLLTAVANRQLAFLEKGIQQIDITPQLNKISEGINKRPTEWEAWVTEWSNRGGISKFKFKVTK